LLGRGRKRWEGAPRGRGLRGGDNRRRIATPQWLGRRVLDRPTRRREQGVRHIGRLVACGVDGLETGWADVGLGRHAAATPEAGQCLHSDKTPLSRARPCRRLHSRGAGAEARRRASSHVAAFPFADRRCHSRLPFKTVGGQGASSHPIPTVWPSPALLEDASAPASSAGERPCVRPQVAQSHRAESVT